MPQPPEATAFISRITSLPKGPGVSNNIDCVLNASFEYEAELRRLFATDRANTRLDDAHVGLVDVFDAPVDIRTTRARVVDNDAELTAKYIMPLTEARRRKEGEPSMVTSLDDFKKNWAIFSEGSLSQLVDWNNVIAAGGAVQACLAPLPEHAKVSKRAMRKWFHSGAYPTSDVDLFIWGLTPEQAEVKINSIYEAVRDSVPWDVTCVRTKHAISIHSQYPYRSVQIVLRLYKSPAEILAGFDVDAPCCAYDGDRVWANPRSIIAMMRQCNTVDVTRRSPSYEVRLAKYSARDFEVYVPGLRRDDVDPTIFERSVARIEGLARLLVLEKLNDAEARTSYLESRRTIRGRPNLSRRAMKRQRKYKGDLKADTAIGGMEMNDYDVAQLHIPYGPGWNARRIEKLVYQTDLGMNSTFNPKNKGRRLHRHPAFFGTMEECVEDCCEHCPEPLDDEEKKLQEEEDKANVRGRIDFMLEDPGRQSMTGSFNPIDVGEWSEQAYIGQTEKFFKAITTQDRATVISMIKEGIDVNRRDHVGRTPLHVAILAKASEIAGDLIDGGARMTARLVDGRTALHLVAQLDLPIILRKLLDRSAINKEEFDRVQLEKAQAEKDEEGEQDKNEEEASEDDWSEITDEKKGKGELKADTGPTQDADIPEDSDDLPDVFDVNLPDWDFALTPLQYAVIAGSLPAVDALLAAGADVKLVTKVDGWGSTGLNALGVAMLTEDVALAGRMMERLLSAGASSSVADDGMNTIFQRFVSSGDWKLVSTLLRSDPNAKAVLNFANYNTFLHPLLAALEKKDYGMTVLLLAHGAKLALSDEDITRALEMSPPYRRSSIGNDYASVVTTPMEVSVAQRDELACLLAALGAASSPPLKRALGMKYSKEYHSTILDWTRQALVLVSPETPLPEESEETDAAPDTPMTWKGQFELLKKQTADIQAKVELQANVPNAGAMEDEKQNVSDFKDYLTSLESLLLSNGAKTWDELFPDDLSVSPSTDGKRTRIRRGKTPVDEEPGYLLQNGQYSWMRHNAPAHLVPLYDELYEAAFTGDNARIQQLCLPEPGAKSQTSPIEISVSTTPGSYSPLFVAIKGRHWDTARLILVIAAAQYHPPEEKLVPFETRDIALDHDNSDEEYDEEDDSEEESETEGAVLDFIDIAKRPSAVRSSVPPSTMLQSTTASLPHPGGKSVYSSSVLDQAIVENDFEAFVHICDLHKQLPEPIPLLLPNQTLHPVVVSDRPEMLDELIRRTGYGINVTSSPQHDGADVEQSKSTRKRTIYLGLNVHGKKRNDLARKGDPNANQADQNANATPLVWSAALAGATNVLEYLSGPRPISAYKYYSATSSDDHAQVVRRIISSPSLDTADLLGWKLSPFNESALTAAVYYNKINAVKALFEINPKLMGTALHAPFKFIKYNALLLAADRGSSKKLVDFLLTKGATPWDIDHRGWNILHLLCVRGHDKLLQHILKKLPLDVIQNLLLQQSRGRMNTPLHLAVKTGRKEAVKAILTTKTPRMLLALDNDGCTPLHCTVRLGYPTITQLLASSEMDNSTLALESIKASLYLENGVGQIPIETAFQQDLLFRIQEKFPTQFPEASVLAPVGQESPAESAKYRKIARWDLDHLEREVPKLSAVIGRLVEEGRLIKGTKLQAEVDKFVNRMEEAHRLARERKRESEKSDDEFIKDIIQVKGDDDDDDEDGVGSTTPLFARQKALFQQGRRVALYGQQDPYVDQVDRSATLKHIREAVATFPGIRQLVHVIDVQKSVQGNLDRYIEQKAKRAPQSRATGWKADEEGLEEAEMDEEEEVKSKTLLGTWAGGSGRYYGVPQTSPFSMDTY
ncbi:hypothetical protein JAAARDRAFT_188410 [Jaapia argillacea MUCL 33604]|uniref:Ankyrin repeat protein n=1 Tax=Jaapia argillacea MUCL 33604 TaxID=933084 RepID=A0A067QDM3_9AGAM|nr:hypothetical protein JAAARDRAFT_188410 [Jaapia argillacea MUCL 33604]